MAKGIPQLDKQNEKAMKLVKSNCVQQITDTDFSVMGSKGNHYNVEIVGEKYVCMQGFLQTDDTRFESLKEKEKSKACPSWCRSYLPKICKHTLAVKLYREQEKQ